MKISFLGSGRVGSTAAFSIMHSLDKLDEIVLFDILAPLAEGEAEDLTHAAYAMDRGDVRISGTTDYAATAGSDIYVVTAGRARKPEETREQLAAFNHNIIKTVGANIAKHSPDAIIITLTNPMDAMNYAMWRATGFERERVIGQGGVLDSSRLHALGHEGMIVGAHGELMVAVPELAPEELEKVRKASQPVIVKKGATTTAPAVAINRMVYAIANDTRETMPCSAILNGEYGLKGVSIGVPVILGASGIEEILEIEMPAGFDEAAKSIKQQIQALKI